MSSRLASLSSGILKAKKDREKERKEEERKKRGNKEEEEEEEEERKRGRRLKKKNTKSETRPESVAPNAAFEEPSKRKAESGHPAIAVGRECSGPGLRPATGPCGKRRPEPRVRPL